MAETDEERGAALEEFRTLQQEQFAGVFEAMEGLPVTIRLLDPPLHEFLPSVDGASTQEVERARIEMSDDLDELEHTLEQVPRLEETNPMLGTRGVRLGILEPEIYRVQVRGDHARGARGARAKPARRRGSRSWCRS